MTRAAAFYVTDPEGHRLRQDVVEFPFSIGRQTGNQLVLRDARISRHHAEVTQNGEEFVLTDLNSRHGLFINGVKTERRVLQDGDIIEFGIPDSFTLIFERPGPRIGDVVEQMPADDTTSRTGGGSNLSKLRAVLEVARALQSSFSVDEVLNSVVDAALVITHAERGFLLLKSGADLRVRSARDNQGGPLRESDLRVPRTLIRQALESRSSALSMQFEPSSVTDPSNTINMLELRSAVCIPLVRIKMATGGRETVEDTAEAIGLLYLDSRTHQRDLAAGNRELLETLAIEASTVMENARLIEEGRAKQHMEEELAVARGIQQGLLPREMPTRGWFRAAGASTPSHHVGGDYYDVLALNENCWAAVVADVSGKGVSSALVASLLQGAFLAMEAEPDSMRRTLQRINQFFTERTHAAAVEPGKYATLFCGVLDAEGELRYVNAGHCSPILAPLNDSLEFLEPTGVPVGLLEDASFEIGFRRLSPGDRLVLYTDGVTEAQNERGDFFGRRRLKDAIRSHADRPCSLLHAAILDSVRGFTGGVDQADDLTLVVLEYRPE